MHGGIDALHGEVGALDDAHLDACAAAEASGSRPLGEPLQRGERVGQVGLQHDAGLEVAQFGLLEKLS